MKSTQLSPQARLQAAYRCPSSLAGYPENTPVLLALSGGEDSRLLLHLLAADAKKTGAPLHLAHLHHGIRGEEADRDAAFCRTLAAHYGLPLHEKRLDIPSLAQACGESIEAVGRRERYAFFAEIMKREGISLLATAHHADDNLETLLLHLTRGCGATGLCGIAPVRPFDALSPTDTPYPPLLTRPLLGVSKTDIAAACAPLTPGYVIDSTNTDLAYSRNALRARVLPALSALVPHPEQRALQTSQSLREDDQYLNALAADWLSSHRLTTPGAKTCVLPMDAIQHAPRPLFVRVLRRLADEFGAPAPEYDHLTRLCMLCHAKGAGELHLPGDLVARCQNNLLTLKKKERSVPDTINLDYCMPLTFGTVALAGGWRVTLERASAENRENSADLQFSAFEHRKNTQNSKNVYNPFIRDTLSFDTIMGYAIQDDPHVLCLRPRHAGDTLRIRGHRHPLRKLQNEVGLDTALRDTLPLLCDARTGEILWAPTVAMSDALCAKGCTLRLTIERSHQSEGDL